MSQGAEDWPLIRMEKFVGEFRAFVEPAGYARGLKLFCWPHPPFVLRRDRDIAPYRLGFIFYGGDAGMLISEDQ